MRIRALWRAMEKTGACELDRTPAAVLMPRKPTSPALVCRTAHLTRTAPTRAAAGRPRGVCHGSRVPSCRTGGRLGLFLTPARLDPYCQHYGGRGLHRGLSTAAPPAPAGPSPIPPSRAALTAAESLSWLGTMAAAAG